MRNQLEIIPSAKIIILLDACRFDVFKQVYDDVGAHDGVTDSNTLYFYRRGWRGAAGSNIIYWRK